MSPLPTPGRKVIPLLGIVLLLAFVSAPALAQNETPGTTNETPAAGGGDVPAAAEGKITRVLTFGVIEEGCPGGAPAPCFDVTTLVANHGDTVVLRGDFRNSAGIHNIHASEGVENGPKTGLAPSALHEITITMPDSGKVRVVCDAHATTMILDVVDPATAATAGGHATSVPAMGVHFLAYWVGVIAFAILFVVYGATFFLFKYNETPATTDHWDRAGEGAPESRRLAAVAPLLAVVIAVVVIAAIIFVATR